MSIREVSTEEADKADAVVCIPAHWPAPFPDNVLDVCARCGGLVQLRPTAPQRPPRICVPCAATLIGRDGGPLQ